MNGYFALAATAGQRFDFAKNCSWDRPERHGRTRRLAGGFSENFVQFSFSTDAGHGK
jgi:hypothetical protein